MYDYSYVRRRRRVGQVRFVGCSSQLQKGHGMVAIIVAIVLVIAAWYTFRQRDAYAGVPVRSAAAIRDLPVGTLVLAYGGVWTGKQDGMTVYVTEVERCTTTSHYNSKTKRWEDDTDCDWVQTDRTTPPFDLVMWDGGEQVPIHVSNGDYRLSGSNRYVYQSPWSRLRGSQPCGNGPLTSTSCSSRISSRSRAS